MPLADVRAGNHQYREPDCVIPFHSEPPSSLLIQKGRPTRGKGGGDCVLYPLAGRVTISNQILLLGILMSYSNFSRDTEWMVEIELVTRSEEHTSELQSRGHIVCRLLLE